VFISNALSPAQVASIKIGEEEKVATVVVPDKQLSLAIGKEGQNARLAAKLTGWRIDIKSVSAIEMERAVSQEVETEAISPEVVEAEPVEAELVEAELAEDIEVEEPVEFPAVLETPSAKVADKQIRFAEDILLGALKAATPDKEKSGIKGKKKGKVVKSKKQEDNFVEDEIEE
jgi:N utilization substance protein A